MLFNWTKKGQTVRFFEEVLFCQNTYNIKTEKQTFSSLSLCQFDAGKRGLPRKFAQFVLFRPIKKRSL